jgi:hypothetical protein
MAKRTITVVFDEDLTDQEYADRGNGIWAALKMAHPQGGFSLESDGLTTVQKLNDRWAALGRSCPWQ